MFFIHISYFVRIWIAKYWTCNERKGILSYVFSSLHCILFILNNSTTNMIITVCLICMKSIIRARVAALESSKKNRVVLLFIWLFEMCCVLCSVYCISIFSRKCDKRLTIDLHHNYKNKFLQLFWTWLPPRSKLPLYLHIFVLYINYWTKSLPPICYTLGSVSKEDYHVYQTFSR